MSGRAEPAPTAAAEAGVDGAAEPAADPRLRSAQRLAEPALALLLTAGALLFLAVSARMIGWSQEAVVSEGAIREAVRRLADGHDIYARSNLEQPPYLVAQYPPLYYAATALLVRLFGGGFWAGRLVSVLGSLAAGAILGHVVRKKTGSAGFGLAAVAAWLSFYHVVMWGTTHRVDALGVAFAAAGVAVFERQRERERTLWPAALLFAAALLVKQVLAAGFLGALLVLVLRREGRRAAGLAIATLAPVAAVCLWLETVSSGGFHVMTVLGTASGAADPPWTIFLNAETFFGSSFALAALAVCLFLLLWRPRPAGLDGWTATFLVGFPLAIATDANIPRFFEPLAAMTVVGTSGLWQLRARNRASYVFALLVLTLGLGAGFLYEERVSVVRERLMNLHEGNGRRRFAAELERLTGPTAAVLAQDLDLVQGSGRPVYLNDPLVFSILAGNGAWDPARLAESVRERRFEAIVLNRPVETLDPSEWITLWIAPAASAVREEYVLAATLTSPESYRFYEAERYYYVPRPRPPSGGG